MGSPDFAVPALETLRGTGRYAPRLVVSQPDRPRGRGRRVEPTAVRRRAEALGLPTVTMSKASYAEVSARVAELVPDVIVVVAFGIILRRDLLELPPLGCVNVHASLLPRHRGTSPIQAAILAGDAVTGCTTMRMDEGVDTGDVLLSESTAIHPDDTAGTLSKRLAGLGAQLLVRTLDALVDGTAEPRPQDDARATTTRKIRKNDGLIDWRRPAVDVERQVRAMTPWPSAFTFLRGIRLIVRAARPRAGEGTGSGAPGTVLSLDPLAVACGDGALVLDEVQPAGRRPMGPEEFLRGHAVDVGARFERVAPTGEGSRGD